jgi:hypothetical protein
MTWNDSFHPPTHLVLWMLHFGARALHHDLDVSLGDGMEPLYDVAPILRMLRLDLMMWCLLLIVHLLGEVT